MPSPTRRSFVKAASAATLAAAVAPAAFAQSTAPSKKRYAIVGVGSRSGMYRGAIHGAYKQHAELVAICDINPGRIELAQRQSKDAGAEAPKAYGPKQFEQMIAETNPDHVIVTTVDSTHHDYIVRAMNAGVDVITEKPLTNTAQRCQQIFDARKRTGRRCRVTFNYRYSPPRTQIKDILMSGEIGEVLSVDFHWLLNTHHGADYFRRWHAHREFSEGLLLHKATHHFDLVNWWLGAYPEQVMATAKREFYTPTMAKRMGLSGAHERCLTCEEKKNCGFYLDLAADKNLKQLYLDNEKYDGYYRDQCVWRAGDHDIDDTMNVLVTYDNNVTLTYSLNAFNSWEGYTIAFNGAKGRLEQTTVESIYVSGTDTVQGAIKPRGVSTVLIPLRGPAKRLETWSGEGAHGGGDKVLLDDIFLPTPPADKYLRAADERAGAASILIGCAANQSIATKQPVTITDLVKGLAQPDYAPMPSRTGPLPMPGKA